MNDRLKFRVWNKHINEYCNIQNLFILPTGETGYFITDGSYPHQRKFMHQEDMIIEMSTGLKDKNGNLIYEGDIVRVEYTTPQGMKIIKDCEVIFDRCAFWLKYNSLSEYLYNEFCVYEIIGNVHKQAKQKDVK